MSNLKKLVEAVAKQHFTITMRCSSIPISTWQTSEKLFQEMIKLAYPEYDEQRVYERWKSCFESVKYCVEYIDFIDN